MKFVKIFLMIILLLISFLSAEEDQHRPKIGLTLSGGGARGIAHIGVLKVLEEAGIKVDYITGTSMGSIVGGLYAIGYSASELEKIILAQNWDEILMDEISLQSISIEEKDDWGRYIGSFPIEEGRINLPVGLVAGQQVHSFINKLCLSVHHIEDFSNLPIPFLCIATDIETGEVVVLKEGFLPDAIRASMSIPSVFAPIEIDGQLLVDGGLIKNFPVSNVIEMGADIVIGVDVGTPLYTKKQLNSLVKIMNQAIAFQAVESTEYERGLCDILIEPAVDDYTIMDFQKAKKMIMLGEEAGRKMLPQLLQLQESLNHYSSPPEIIPLTNIERVFIKKIHIQGLRNVSRNLVMGKLGININEWLSTSKLTKSVERIYGSQYFEKVSYKLEPVNNGVELFIRVIEKSASYLNFGFHYDSEMDASILINTTFRNKIIMGSKLSLTAELSRNSAFKASYFIHTGWKPGFGFGLSLRGVEFKVPRYEDSQKVGIYNYSTTTSNFDIQTIFSNSFTVGGGLEFRYTALKPDIITPDATEVDYQLFSYRGYCLINTYDRIAYPRNGIKLVAEARRMFELRHSLGEKHDPISLYFFRATIVDKLWENIIYEETVYFGSLQGSAIRPDSYFYLGGIYEPEINIIPFVGQKFVTLSAENIAVLSSTLRLEIRNGLYVSVKGNYARLGSSLEELFNDGLNYYGSATSLGLMTPIGPLEFTVSDGNDEKETLYFITIGYYF